MNAILLLDKDFIDTRPLSRFRSIFSTLDGAFTVTERLKKQYPGAEFYFSHPDKTYEKLISLHEGFYPYSEHQNVNISLQITSEHLRPAKLMESFQKQIIEDSSFFDTAVYRELAGIVSSRGQLVGSLKDLYIHKTATILPGVIFDTRSGPVIIDENTEVTPFSYLCGPLYVGKNAKIDSLKASSSSFGDSVRLGGEVESSIIHAFTNKHHEGFIGHSLIGSWVNLGALTTTSDLKNNYGKIRLSLPAQFYPGTNPVTVTVETSSIKFGSIIGDCVKTAIGTMLNTGTVIDAGSTIFGGNLKKYHIPFSWGTEGDRYKQERFLKDCETIFSRRKQTVTESFKSLTSLFF